MYESFATVWERVADAIPDAPAVVQGDRRVTYREVEGGFRTPTTALVVGETVVGETVDRVTAEIQPLRR